MRSAERQFEKLHFPEEDMSGALHPNPSSDPNPAPYSDSNPDPRAALKQQVAERLAAHRSRRGHPGTPSLVPIPVIEPKPLRARTSRIATAVAERYAQTQSYRDFLAAEAARAIEAANAAAEIATRNAHAVTIAQQQLLAELDQWSEPARDDTSPAPFIPGHNRAAAHAPAPPATSVPLQHPIAGLTVRLYADVAPRPEQTVARLVKQPGEGSIVFDEEEENFLLDDEIAFRQTPIFAEPPGPTVPIPANLLEFPRQLVAPRKARPRLAEGPLREEADTTPATSQLRIFEVEADQISTVPGIGAETLVPEWSSIHLDAAPIHIANADSNVNPTFHPELQQELHTLLPLETASLNLRLMAAAVDGCILGFTLLLAAAAFACATPELPALPIAALATVATLFVLFVLYHLLFFTFSNATPGMRYARIGLCTFTDDNPTSAQMRRRIWAILLSACPLGIGLLWALLDDDRLGWHDRISRMYQRSY